MRAKLAPFAGASVVALAVVLTGTVARADVEDAQGDPDMLPIPGVASPRDPGTADANAPAAGQPPPPAGESPAAAPPERASRPEIYADIGPAISVGLGPGPTVGGEIGVGVRFGQLSGEVSGRAETTMGDPSVSSGDRMTSSLVAAAVTGCEHFGQLSACVRFYLGALQVKAPDVVQSESDSSGFFAPALRLAYVVPAGSRFGVRLALEGGVPLVRRTYDVSESPIWRVPAAFGDATVAWMVRLP